VHLKTPSDKLRSLSHADKSEVASLRQVPSLSWGNKTCPIVSDDQPHFFTGKPKVDPGVMRLRVPYDIGKGLLDYAIDGEIDAGGLVGRGPSDVKRNGDSCLGADIVCQRLQGRNQSQVFEVPRAQSKRETTNPLDGLSCLTMDRLHAI
jgi:hypothetical protein